jgi:uncharacterized protein (TIGR02246 family)
MRQFLLAALIAASAFALPACTTTPASAPLIERGNVMDVSRRVTESYAAAWNANDMARFGALYAPDARHVTLQGQFLRGRTAIVAAHRANRPRYAAGVRMVTQLEGARAITDDAIVAVMRLEFVNDPSAAGGIQAVRMTLTLAKRGDEWLIAQAQASEPD